MKKNYFSPAIETTVIALSSAILDASADDNIQQDLGNGFAPDRRRPF